MRTIWQDLRYSARLLRKHPGFTLTAVGVLTLGIGVNAGVFGIINGLMIRPLAGADAPGEVVGVFSKDRTAARDYRPFSYPGFSDVRDAGGPFAHLAGHTVALAGVTENNTTRQATVDIVTTGFFETLGVQPVYGRDFTMEEERPGTAARSVIVSYKVWERSGLDRDILKQTVRINGQDFAIVGVAPQHFTGTTAILGAEYYLPIGVHDAIASDFDADGRFPISDRRSRPLILVGRLKPGVTRASSGRATQGHCRRARTGLSRRQQEPGSGRGDARPSRHQHQAARHRRSGCRWGSCRDSRRRCC